MALAFLMTAIAIIDWRYFIIPDQLNLASLALGLSYAAFAGREDWAQAVAVAVAQGLGLALIFYCIRRVYAKIRRRQGIGLGDVKLAGVAGVWLSPQMIPVAIQIAAVAALGFALFGRGLFAPGARFSRLPFGTFLAPSICLCWAIDARIFFF
jgi:leader peptidase (prepilin peptidase) / N-methyltransferase